MLLMASLTLAHVGHAQSSGMDAFVREVLSRNPSLRAEALRRDASRQGAKAEGLWPDPVASVMVDRVPEHAGATEMPMIRYQVQQMLPWPGKLGMMRSAAESQADEASASEQVRKLDLVLDAKRAWLMLLLNRRQREINRVSFGLLTSIASAAAARYGAGTGGHHELARADVERNAVEVEKVALDGERVSVVAMLNALRNLPADAPIADPEPFESSPLKVNAPDLVNTALRERPEVKRMEAMVREMGSMADLARRERYPDLMVGAWFNQMIGEPSSAGAMVGVAVPVFGIRRQNRRAGAFDLRSSSAQSDVDAMRAMVRFEVADASRKVETATREVEFLRAIASPRAHESFEVSLASYATGGADMTALLEARRALQAVELATVQAVVSREMALAELERATGGRGPEVKP
jgi:outer membrane protein TolC